jgi:alpha,alpha-trehalase
LSTYHGEGIGIPPETEASHFDHILGPFAKKHGLGIEEFVEKYQSNEIHEPFLDEYFVHDRSGRL